MDDTPQSYAYRCLPLNIANQFGWEIINPIGFTATWAGEPSMQSLQIIPDQEGVIATSHFGSGILTFHVNVLFRTAPETAIFVQGPVNTPKAGIYALSGIIETDWSPYTFTMNWLFPQPGSVRFEGGEPFAHFFPVSLPQIEAIEPSFLPIESDPDTYDQHKQWTESRQKFISGLVSHDTEIVNEKWQKSYYRGMNQHGDSIKNHYTKLRLKPFVR
jgi:hypothetical protein